MNILFVINNNGPGKGGHYHSLDHISKALGVHVNAKIVSIGKRPSPVLKENQYFACHFEFKWYNFFKLNYKFKKLTKEFEPAVVHCFDSTSLVILQSLPVFWGKKMVQNRCGGPNRSKFLSPIAGAIVLFSEENYHWYKSNSRLRKTPIFLIPNRISKTEVLSEENRELKKTNDTFTFVRITRISPYYKKSLLQGFELIRLLNKKQKVKLIVIGSVYDENLFRELQTQTTDERLPVQFITDKNTNRASQLLYLADAVIGTGRGAMEAMSLGIPVLAPLEDYNIPCLVYEDTFNDLFKTNFSERGQIKKELKTKLFCQIERMIIDKNYYDLLSGYSKIKAKKFFLLDEAATKYIEVYDQAKRCNAITFFSKNILQFFYYLREVKVQQKKIFKS